MIVVLFSSPIASQRLFDKLPGGGVLGLFVYAAAITLLFANYLGRQSAQEELRNSMIGPALELASKFEAGRGGGQTSGRESLTNEANDDDASVKSRRKELLLAAARLVVRH